MDTPSSTTPSSAKTSSGQITAAIGAVFLVLLVVFAFNSAWYTHWYALFRAVHVVGAVFWVGGGLMITTLALLAERRNDAQEMATIARQASAVGEKLFAPAGLIVLLMGIGMMINTNWGWGKFWVVFGLLGYAATFAVGLGVLSPRAKKLSSLMETQGPTAPETQAAIKEILLIARVDVAVLLLVVADMVVKPFS